jgi:hypothetical protein
VIAPEELAIQRMLTANFVAADTISVAFLRATKVPNGAGGFRTVRAPIAAQTVRMNPLQDGAAPRTTADGVEVSPQYMIVAPYTTDVRRGDQFAVDGRRYEVVFIVENRQYQVKAEVYYLGD